MSRKHYDYWKKFTPTQMEAMKKKYSGKHPTWWQKPTLKQIEERTKKRFEYWKTLLLEQKEELKKRICEHKKKLTSMQIEGMRRKGRKRQCKYMRKLTPEQIELKRQKQREYYKNLTPERKLEIHQKQNERRRLRYKKLTPKQNEEIKTKKKLRYEKLTSDQKEEREKRNYEHSKKCRQRKKEIEQSKKCVKQNTFCDKCQIQFLNSNALLEHVVTHVTSPSIILFRIDEQIKALNSIKKESKNVQINSELYSNTSLNVIHNKTKSMECDADIKYKFNNTYVNKTLDSIKKESVNTITNSDSNSNTPENVIHIKTEYMEYDEDIKYEFNDIHMNIKTETEIKSDSELFSTHVKKEN